MHWVSFVVAQQVLETNKGPVDWHLARRIVSFGLMLDDLVEEGWSDHSSCAIEVVLAVGAKVKAGASAVWCGVADAYIGATVAMGATWVWGLEEMAVDDRLGNTSHAGW